jgi:hypothetical protein
MDQLNTPLLVEGFAGIEDGFMLNGRNGDAGLSAR